MNKSRVMSRPEWTQGLSNQGFWYKYRGTENDKPLYKLIVLRGYIKTPYEKKKMEEHKEKELERMLAAAADYAEDYQYTMDDAIEQNIKADGRLQESISRSRRLVLDYARCNKFKYFFTGTLNRNKQRRDDLDVFRKKFTQMIRDLRRRKGAEIDFLVIPELHDDGQNWHIHAFLNGVPDDELELFTLDQYLPYKIIKKLKRGEKVYNWVRYAGNFGFNEVEIIRNCDALSRYVTTKYMRKDMEATAAVLDSGKHLFFASRGLNRPERIDAYQAIDEIEKYNDSGGNIKNCPALLVGTQDRPRKIEIVSSYEFDYGFVEWYSLKT